jgi:hypothetical protein
MPETQPNTAPVTTQAAEATNPATTTTTQATATPAAAATDPKAASSATGDPAAAAQGGAQEKGKETLAAKIVPEKYEFKLPDGSLLKQPEVDEISKLAKERGYSADEAQKYLEERNGIKSGFLKEQQQEFSQLRGQWKDTFINDKELGGQKAQESAELAKRFVDRFASDDLKKALNDFGFGDHPELIRVFARAGRAMAEDKFVPGGQPVAGEATRTADLLYPSHSKKE